MKKNTALKCFIFITILSNAPILFIENSIQTSSCTVKDTNPSLTTKNFLIDFVGNWSNLESHPANGRYFSNYTINHDILVFGSPTIDLEGNGNLMFNLTTHDYERNLNPDESLLFHWIDFGPLEDACYIGIVLRFRIDTGETRFIYLGKHFYCVYGNRSDSVLKFASPTVELGTVWERWGISMVPFFEFFDTTIMTLLTISYIHQSTDANNGPRFVRYAQPLLVEELPRYPDSQGAFLGTYNISNSQPKNETILLEDTFEDLKDWIITNPNVITRNDIFGTPAPSVEIQSSLTQKGVCRQELFLPELKDDEYVRTSVDFFIPKHQIGSISVITGSDTSSVLFPFQIRVVNTSKVRFTIYEQPPDHPKNQTWHEFPFQARKWYHFDVHSYNDHYTLKINEIQIISVDSHSYHSSWTDLCFGDGSDRTTSSEQGHYFWDNIKVLLKTHSASSSSTAVTSSLTATSSRQVPSSNSTTTEGENIPNITSWTLPLISLLFLAFVFRWIKRPKER